MSNHQVATDDAVRWLRSLPAGAVDCILTDPPYSSGGFNETSRRAGSSTSQALPWLMGDSLGTLAMSHLLREVALEARRVIKPGGTLTVFSDWKMVPVFAPVIESAGWRWRAQIVWDKAHFAQGVGWLPQHEMVLHFCDATTAYHANLPNVVRVPRVHHALRDHPTQKPVELLAYLLKPLVSAGGVVADPFAGSGSIIEAAERVGAVAWCCDADPTHAASMRRRASREAAQEALL